jgi:dTDP-4-dehydrorhamnose 3,5-epimerase-like enzyme
MELYRGDCFQDLRGILTFNNDFDASSIKRIYTIENFDTDFIRGWQGHKIEQRWFACMNGKFRIGVIYIDDFENPLKTLKPQYYELNSSKLDFLHVAAGCVTSIQSLEKNSKLLVLADYKLNEVKDEYRFNENYFENE